MFHVFGIFPIVLDFFSEAFHKLDLRNQGLLTLSIIIEGKSSVYSNENNKEFKKVRREFF